MYRILVFCIFRVLLHYSLEANQTDLLGNTYIYIHILYYITLYVLQRVSARTEPSSGRPKSGKYV